MSDPYPTFITPFLLSPQYGHWQHGRRAVCEVVSRSWSEINPFSGQNGHISPSSDWLRSMFWGNWGSARRETRFAACLASRFRTNFDLFGWLISEFVCYLSHSFSKNNDMSNTYHNWKFAQIHAHYRSQIAVAQREREESLEWARKEAALVNDDEKRAIEVMDFRLLRGA